MSQSFYGAMQNILGHPGESSGPSLLTSGAESNGFLFRFPAPPILPSVFVQLCCGKRSPQNPMCRRGDFHLRIIL